MTWQASQPLATHIGPSFSRSLPRHAE